MTNRKKPGVAFWATVVVVVGLVLYPLSLGPACWTTSHLGTGAWAVSFLYSPIVKHSPPPISRILMTYSTIGAAPYWCWDHVGGIPTSTPGVCALGIVTFWGSDALPPARHGYFTAE